MNSRIAEVAVRFYPVTEKSIGEVAEEFYDAADIRPRPSKSSPDWLEVTYQLVVPKTSQEPKFLLRRRAVDLIEAKLAVADITNVDIESVDVDLPGSERDEQASQERGQ